MNSKRKGKRGELELAKVDIYAGYKGFPRVHTNLEIEA